MRKILSIVIAVLMVSMMIPSMVLASETAISVVKPAALVAGEEFTLTPTYADGATTVTLEVNSQVFSIEGVTGDPVDSVYSCTKNAGESFKVKVAETIPAEPFKSAVRISDSTGDTTKVELDIEDRLVGDANGDDEITVYDAVLVASHVANGRTVDGVNFNAGDVNKDGLTVFDAVLIASYVAQPATSPITDMKTYMGKGEEIDVNTIVDPFEKSDEPEEPAVVVGEVTKLYAYYQNGTIYYTFTAGANATSYAISVNGVAVELDDATATSGSFTFANWNEDGENTIAVVAKAEGATDSAEVTKVIEVADASGALADWLNENGLNDVTITVYEIE